MLARPMRAPILFALALLTALPGSAAAQDGPVTAVMPFAGRSPRAVERGVERALERNARVLDAAEVRRAAEDAGARGTEADGIAELAAALGAEIVVQGRVWGTRRAPKVELVVRAPDGAELARGTLDFGRGPATGRRFAARVGALFERALAAMSERRAPPPPDEQELAAFAALDDERPPVLQPEPPPAAPDDGLAVFSAVVGAAVRNRDAAVQLGSGGERTYASGPYPEIAVALEVRPFANDTHLGRGLFLRGAFGHSLGLGSTREDPACESASPPAECSVDTNFFRWAADLGWLLPLGDAGELGVGFGVAYDGYHLADNVVLPTAEYLALRPLARARVRMLREALVLDLEVAYRAVLGVGELASSFGDRTTAHGVDAGIGIGGNLLPVADLGLTWALRFDWVGYFLAFAGSANDVPGTSGSESALRATFLIGWSFR